MRGREDLSVLHLGIFHFALLRFIPRAQSTEAVAQMSFKTQPEGPKKSCK